VTDYWGNKGYATVIINVGETGGPKVDINTTPDPPTGTAPFTVYFDASGTDLGTECGGTATYSWDFGDGGIGTGVTTSHTYTSNGIYTVVLTVTNSTGNVGYGSVIITVGVAGEVNAVINTIPDPPPTGVAPFTVYFDAYGSTSESGIVSYEWEFGDGESGTGITVNHTYENIGSYIAYLTITDSNGYEAYDSVIVTVKEVKAVIATTPSPATGFIPFTVGFNASGSTVEVPPIVSYEWDFDGDGITDATGITAVHPFTIVGTYLVQLTVTDSAANEYVAFVTVIANKAPN